MALSILDGTQTATTLSTILSSGQHITAHTVVSLGTQAITDMRGAVSGSVVSISNFPATQTIAGTVTANIGLNVAQSLTGGVSETQPPSAVRIGWSGEENFNGVGVDNGGQPLPIQIYLGSTSDDRVTTANPLPISGTVTIGSAIPAGTNRIGVVTIGGGTVTIGAGTAQIGSVTVGNTVTIAGTVTANAGQVVVDQGGDPVDPSNPFPIFGTVDITALPAGTNRIGVVTIGAGTVTIGAGTAQIGSVTASISNSVTIASLPAIGGTVTANVFGLGQITEGFALIPVMNFADPIGDSSIGNIVPIQITNPNGTVDGNNPLPISGTVTANTFALQGTAVTTSNFTSTTASTVLANYNATREVLTIFNEGAGLLFVCPGATCTTVQYQVRLSSGDYYEVPNHQSTITHSAVFATAGTARVTEVS